MNMCVTCWKRHVRWVNTCGKRRVPKMNMCVTCSNDECMRNVLKEMSICVKRDEYMGKETSERDVLEGWICVKRNVQMRYVDLKRDMLKRWICMWQRRVWKRDVKQMNICEKKFANEVCRSEKRRVKEMNICDGDVCGMSWRIDTWHDSFSFDMTHIWCRHTWEWVLLAHSWEALTSTRYVTCYISMSHVTHTNESSHMWMRHECQWVMSHMNESCHIWMSHVTYEWVMSHMNEACHIWMSHVTYEWVMSHMNVSWQVSMSIPHDTYQRAYATRELVCDIYSLRRVMTSWHVMTWVKSHVTWCVTTRINELCHTWALLAPSLEALMSTRYVTCHMWMSHVTCEWFISHANESCIYLSVYVSLCVCIYLSVYVSMYISLWGGFG